MSLKGLATKRFGRLHVLGFVGRWIPRGGTEKQDHYLCRCDCGRKIQVTWQELDSGVVHSCPDCISLAPLPLNKLPTWSAAMVISNDVTKELLIYFGQVPKWWWASLSLVVDELINMMARGIYTDAQICRYFECPQGVLDVIRKHYHKKIHKVNREYRKIQEQFKDIKRIPSELIPAGRFMTIFRLALVNTSKRYRGGSND